MTELVKTLCMLDGVSGFEDRVRDFIREQAEPFADSVREDAMGSLIVFKRGARRTGDRLLLAAHMDEVGLIVTEVTDEGYLRFRFVGGVDRRVAFGKPVLVGPEHIPGVIGMKAVHLVKAAERGSVPRVDELYIDIGAPSGEAARAQVPLGSYAVFAGGCVEFGSGLLKAKALDDRIGCAVLLTLLKEPLPLDCTFAFTVQEEVGTRGAFGAAFSVTPQVALVLEGTTAADCATVPAHKRVCAPGKGPVIPFMDGGTVYDRGLYETLTGLCRTHGIPWQTKEYVSGGTDARTIQRTKAGVRAAGISAAVRYLHSPSSVAAVGDLEPMLRLTRLFLNAMAGELEEDGYGAV